ncbi:hypothetical protein [Gaetbulibacter sp. PBL-D1]|uniref:hypothetical protein n=1 Tax=Gaetbulibacter sp. PBL-D1 TaxID=3422594 RepID=UPI003D2EDDFE
MNKRVKEVIVAIQNSKIVYADTNLNTFVRILKVLEPNTPSKDTLKRHLDLRGFYYFTTDFGTAYHICRYDNPNYVGLKRN